MDKNSVAYLSIFAGRIADTGVDPAPIIKKSVKLSKKFKNSLSSTDNKRQIDDQCVWAEGSDILSHFICNINFENEVIGNINFSCFGPASKDQETLEVVGVKGKLKLIRSTGMIEITYDFRKKI